MRIVSFQLTMPNVGSWNGKWSGQGKPYFVTRKLSDNKAKELDGKNYYYSWDDGWGANIEAKIIDAKEAKKIRSITGGFCGYDWMVDSIIQNGEIQVN